MLSAIVRLAARTSTRLKSPVLRSARSGSAVRRAGLLIRVNIAQATSASSAANRRSMKSASSLVSRVDRSATPMYATHCFLATLCCRDLVLRARIVPVTAGRTTSPATSATPISALLAFRVHVPRDHAGVALLIPAGAAFEPGLSHPQPRLFAAPRAGVGRE